MIAQSIHINGIVQGVGFRPFVARLARKVSICGWVRNDPDGVHILAQGSNSQLTQFYQHLQSDAPEPARIINIAKQQCEIDTNYLHTFEIVASEHDGSRDTLISPDIATCPDCLDELFDQDNRRYHYPFINCTNCGPRFTIIEDLPYDRLATSMHEFPMCASCSDEYNNENDRRYHAQPNACFTCGPQLWWCENNPDSPTQIHNIIKASNIVDSDAIIKRTACALSEGKIATIKGLGGWHLACNATNEQAVSTLRARKHRPAKPLALMVKDIKAAHELCILSPSEETALLSSVRPIVLCQRKKETPVTHSVANTLPELGIMLPSTPIQHLLFEYIDFPIVMTSGNRSGEPIVAKDKDALKYLASIADVFLGNNRAIVARYDDSVVRVLENESTQIIRRARGIAPSPLIDTSSTTSSTTLSQASTQTKTQTQARTQAQQQKAASVIFAAGSEQKSTFCFLRDKRAYISQHLGDLETLGAWNAWQDAFNTYSKLFDLHPEILTCDKHPEYVSSKWARAHSSKHDFPLIEVQHHHAHIASIMGENNLFEPVIGIALDGTGYGNDGTIWGGEILLTTRQKFTREWHLPLFPLLGGAAAIKDPRRIAYSLLRTFNQMENPQFKTFLESLPHYQILEQMYDKNLNAPLCSSMGRLFDGISALLQLCQNVSYDGEAACLLEAQAQKESINTAYNHSQTQLSALSFHEYIAQVITKKCIDISNKTGVYDIALGGGCMANRLLFKLLNTMLASEGFTIYTNKELPPNDGCISYGQAIVAQAQVLGE